LLSPPIAIDDVPVASLCAPIEMALAWLAVETKPMAMAPI